MFISNGCAISKCLNGFLIHILQKRSQKDSLLLQRALCTILKPLTLPPPPLISKLEAGSMFPYLLDAKPIGQVSGIGEGRGESDHADLALSVVRDEVSPGYNHFKNWPSLITYKCEQKRQ